MKVSTLTGIASTLSVTDVFAGYNHNLRISESESYDEQNMASDNYPVMSPRQHRGTYLLPTDHTVTATPHGEFTVTVNNATYIFMTDFELGKKTFIWDGTQWKLNGQAIEDIGTYGITVSGSKQLDDSIDVQTGISLTTHSVNGMIAKDALCYVDGTTLYINRYPVSGLTLTNGEKQLISMGAFLIIFPDKKWVNTANTTEYGTIDNTFTLAQGATVTYTMCNLEGADYDATAQNTPPTNPVDKQYWVDTSSTPHILKQYSASAAMWVQIATTYIKIKGAGIGAGFDQYDGVKLSGISSSITQLADLNGKISVLYKVNHDATTPANDYIVVVGMLDSVSTQTGGLVVSRNMPLLDFVTECGNRLWGCRYGSDNDGNVVNEIYACKQGDFKNWNVFMGISTDSYTASCGTDGQFTGAITHLGYPLFFKENVLHKVYGNYPAQYQITSTVCRGVQKGAGKSLAIVNETLFYKSRQGICSYDGSLPLLVSSYLGDDSYSGVDESMSDKLINAAVGGAHGNKYYVNMKSNRDGKWYLLTYDTGYGLWHKEDEIRIDSFCSCRDEMYFIDHATHKIRTVLGSGYRDTGRISWMAESGDLGTSSVGKKYVGRVLIRMSMDFGSRIRFFIQYDSSGIWEQVHELVGKNLRTFPFTLRPKRCDHFKLRIVGEGDAKIYSISKYIEEGSDV